MEAFFGAFPPTSTGDGDPVVDLLLRVAQRADELARVAPSGGSARRDRETWDRAESELIKAGKPPRARSRRRR